MRMKFKCQMMPNGMVSNTRFENGVAEVESALSEEINALMSSPFVECLSTMAGSCDYSAEVKMSTMRNRINKMNKVDVIRMAEEMGLPCGDRTLTHKFFSDMILKAKYPDEFAEEVGKNE